MLSLDRTSGIESNATGRQFRHGSGAESVDAFQSMPQHPFWYARRVKPPCLCAKALLGVRLGVHSRGSRQRIRPPSLTYSFERRSPPPWRRFVSFVPLKPTPIGGHDFARSVEKSGALDALYR